ncbi:MAG: outer membrane beta-barrel protein [Maribacter sp.]
MKLSILMMVLCMTTLHAQNTQNTQRPSDASPFQIGLNAGFAYRTAPLSDEIQDDFRQYAQNLKSGVCFGLDLNYNIKPQWGIGAKYLQFHSVNTLNFNGVNPDGSARREKGTDKVNIRFMGPTYFARMPLANNRHILSGTLGLGYMSYSLKSEFRADYQKLSGGTFGTTFELGYDYQLNKTLSIGAQLGGATGVLNKVTFDDGSNTEEITLEGDNRENLSFLHIGGGLKLSL